MRRQAQAVLVAIVALCAAASATADPGSVAAKQAQAQQVLSQINRIDESLGAAVEQYNLANVRLHKIEGDLRENKKQLALARANLKISQKSLAARLVTAYTSTEDNSTLALLLGSTSFEDLLNRVETVNSTSNQDANIVRQVRSSKLAIQHHEVELRTAHEQQQQIVAQKAAQRQHIESQLAQRRQLLSSIKGEIQRIKAAEAAQQRQLAAAAQADRQRRRCRGLDPGGLDRRSAERPRRRRRDRDALPGRAVRVGRVEPARVRLFRARDVRLRADRRLAPAQLVRAGRNGHPGVHRPASAG
jgi:peptidoglycan hydrolase CwlO-like protein